MEPSPSRGANQSLSYSENSQHFTEPEGSLPGTKEPAIGPNHEADKSSLYPQRIYLKYVLIVASHLRLDLPSCLFPSGSGKHSQKLTSS
jgi:hypothetical protein